MTQLILSKSFIADIKNIIRSARNEVVRTVEFHRVQMYWKLGKRIVNEEQQGEERAEYGAYIIRNLAKQLESEFGKGFSKRQLELCRQFYCEYPIANMVRSQFNWFQYRLFIRIKEKDKREFYTLETLKNSWSGKELERQINAQLYERLLMSSDKESVLAVARSERLPQSSKEIVKDPLFLEFLGLEDRTYYYEKDLESALIEHLQTFLLELGNGFTFVARQKRLIIEDESFFADLVFYNRLLRCFVVIELKTEKISHQDIGQLQMYVNYFDRYEKTEDEKPTIGILLAPTKNQTLVELTLPQDANIYASEYQLYLPKKEVSEEKLDEWVEEFELVRTVEEVSDE